MKFAAEKNQPCPSIMKMRELDRLLSAAPDRPPPASAAAGFADAVLAKLPGMRFVIPGSHPGVRILVLAGALGLLTALGISLLSRAGSASNPEPPPLVLFQPGAVEPSGPPAPP